MYEEKARQKLHKDSACYFEQSQGAEPYKKVDIRPFSSNLAKPQWKVSRTWWSQLEKNEIINDVLLTSTHGHNSLERSVNASIHQLCADTECRLEDLPR